ncbi:hypothetical protein ACTFIV_004064 [Dictyostelium citrinum]
MIIINLYCFEIENGNSGYNHFHFDSIEQQNQYQLSLLSPNSSDKSIGMIQFIKKFRYQQLQQQMQLHFQQQNHLQQLKSNHRKSPTRQLISSLLYKGDDKTSILQNYSSQSQSSLVNQLQSSSSSSSSLSSPSLQSSSKSTPSLSSSLLEVTPVKDESENRNQVEIENEKVFENESEEIQSLRDQLKEIIIYEDYNQEYSI